MPTAHFNHASIFNIIQRVRFVFARRKELAQKGDATAKMEVWFQRRGHVRSLLGMMMMMLMMTMLMMMMMMMMLMMI